LAANRNPYDNSGKVAFLKTSKCRVCERPLTWGDRTYNFDHKDNNPANNSQTNCYLVCKVCHGKHTVVRKRKVKGFLGETEGYETIRKKVGYKKPKKKAQKTRRVAVRGLFGEVVKYRTVKIRKAKKKSKTAKSKRDKKKRGRKVNKAANPQTRVLCRNSSYISIFL
jgi:hypothetical protein